MFGSRKRPIFLSLAVASALVLLAGDIAWSRAGGGSSAGSRGGRTYSAPAPTNTAPGATAPMERSMTQPARPNAAPGAPGMAQNRPGGMFGGFGGVMGGLAAGFLGAGLLGMLFGNGFMSGLGGFASMLGLLLQIGIVAFLGMFLWRMWQNRRRPAPAMASGPQVHPRDVDPRHGDGMMQRQGLGGGLGGLAPSKASRP